MGSMAELHTDALIECIMHLLQLLNAQPPA